MTQDEHAVLQELLGAYVLHAVDDDERRLVDDHLPSCPRCRAEVDELREVTALLAQSGAPAPEGVWDRIADSIGAAGTAPPLRLVVGDRPEEARSDRRWGRSLAAVAAAAAVAIVALSVQVLRLQDQVDDADRPDAADQVAAILGDPEARRTQLVDGDGDVLAVAAVLPSGAGAIDADDLPDLDTGVYQLWGATGTGEAVSLGVFDRRGDVALFNADPSMTVLMITAESAAVARSEQPPVVIGQLS